MVILPSDILQNKNKAMGDYTMESKPKKTNFKIYFLGFIPSAIAALVIIFVINFFTYPISVQNILKKTEPQNVLAFERKQGSKIYIMESGDGYELYIFARSAMTNRFRLHARLEYDTAVVSEIPGTRNYFVVRAEGESITIYPPGRTSRLYPQAITGFFTIAICINSIVYHYTKYRLRYKHKNVH